MVIEVRFWPLKVMWATNRCFILAIGGLRMVHIGFIVVKHIIWLVKYTCLKTTLGQKVKLGSKGQIEVKKVKFWIKSYQCCTVMFRFGGKVRIFDRSCGTRWTWRVWNDRIWSLFYNGATASSIMTASTAHWLVMFYWWCYRWGIHWGNTTAATSTAKERNVSWYRLRCSGTHWSVIESW